MVSDIPANKEVALPEERYFRCGDFDDLKANMRTLLKKRVPKEERERIRSQIKKNTIGTRSQCRRSRCMKKHFYPKQLKALLGKKYWEAMKPGSGEAGRLTISRPSPILS